MYSRNGPSLNKRSIGYNVFEAKAFLKVLCIVRRWR